MDNRLPALPSTIGQIANEYAKQSVLQEYQDSKAEETTRRQKVDIGLFEQFLQEAGQPATNLYSDLSGWSVVTWGLVEGFRRWLLQQGYKVSSVNVRLSTIKRYCKLATKAGHLDFAENALIDAVEMYRGKEAGHIDEKRRQAAIVVGRSTKKAKATPLKPEHVDLLKQQPDTPDGRRDRLIICLLFDHALRCGEVALLDVKDIELDPALHSGTLYITSEKTESKEGSKVKAILTPDTYDAASAYLSNNPREEGPLFIGKISKDRMNERSIYHRVRLAGKHIGLKLSISPHDGRHFYADDALDPENQNSIADIQRGGRWKSPAMVLRYATEREAINQNLKLTATRKREKRETID